MRPSCLRSSVIAALVGRRPAWASSPGGRSSTRIAPVEILSADHVEAIHGASLRILREIGVEVLGDRALDLLARAGADDRPRAAQRPARPGSGRGAHRQRARGVHAPRPEPGAEHRPRRQSPGLRRGRRAGVRDRPRPRPPRRQLRRLPRLRPGHRRARHHPPGGRRPARADRPARRDPPPRHVPTPRDTARQDLAVPGFGARSWSRTPSRSPVSPAGSTATRWRASRALMTIINTNSPLRLDGPMSDGLIEMATHGQPVVVTPFTLAGAMTPVTLAGALAQQNAEALFMVALAQLARPGCAGGLRRVHLERRHAHRLAGVRDARVRQGARSRPASSRAATGCRGARRTPRHRTSSTPRPPTSREMSIWGAIMGGVNLLYQGAGWLEGGLTASFEKLILDAEMLQMMAEVLVAVRGRRGDARARRHRRGRAGRALLRVGPHARALRDGVLPAARCRTGGTSRPGRRTAPGPRPSERTGSGSSSWPSTSRRRSTRRCARRSTRSWPGASGRSRPEAEPPARLSETGPKRRRRRPSSWSEREPAPLP